VQPDRTGSGHTDRVLPPVASFVQYAGENPGRVDVFPNGHIRIDNNVGETLPRALLFQSGKILGAT
jgi:hypothetical protein